MYTAALLLILVFQPSSNFGRASATSSGLVISQVYGGGGNAGAPYTHDFVEIYNRSADPVSLGSLSIQYASATGSGNFGGTATQLTPLPNVLLAPGGYFLIQEAGGTTGASLPTPDLIDSDGPIAMSATAGKVALVSGADTLGCNGGSSPCSPAQLARIIDLVGYGTGSGGANFFEGASAAPTTNNTRSVIRIPGNIDSDQNGADFVISSPPTPRGGGVLGDPTLSVNDVTLSEGNAVTAMTFTISLNHIAAGNVSYSIATEDEGSATAGIDYQALSLPSQIIPAGSLSATHEVTIYGDLLEEMNETFIVRLSAIVGALPGDTEGRGTITNDDIPLTAIHDIQGPGQASPIANGSSVATRGIVTARKTNGFFLQTPDSEVDTDANTSEALFVFTGSAPAVAAGDDVVVSGRLSEFRRSADLLPETLTEITGPSVTVMGSGTPLPAPIDVADVLGMPDPNETRPEQLERFEGMLMTTPAMDVVGPTNVFGELFAVLPSAARPFREPGIDISEALPAGAPASIDRFDGNHEVLMLDSDDLVDAAGVRRPRLDVSVDARIDSVSGPLDYAFDDYRIALDASASATGGVMPADVPSASAAEFTIASLNLENFRDGTATFPGRMQKASLVVAARLRTPDILGLIEVGDLEDLQELAGLVNARAGTNYEAYLLDGDGQSTGFEQNIGYLVNLDRIEVLVAPYQVYQGKKYEFAGNPDLLLHDRPPLVLEARIRHTGTPVTVILNHLRSLIGVNSFENIGGGFTEGQRVRYKRRLQAEDLADLIQSHIGENLVVLGDMNAFDVSDGLVDVIGTLKGSPAPPEEVVDASVDRWSYELTDLPALLADADRYSYVFGGSAQVLDHVLVNAPMLARLSNFVYARNNADFPESFASDFTSPTRISDHDGAVAYFTPIANVGVAATATAPVAAGSTLTLDVTASNAGDTATDVSVFAMLPPGVAWQHTTAPAGWTCNESAGTVTCQATSLGAGESAALVIEALVQCTVSNGTVVALPVTIGSSTTEADVSDNSAAASSTVSNPAPTISGAAVSRQELLLPQSQMVPVTVTYDASDACGPVTASLGVTSNEPVTGHGQGRAGVTSPDWEVVSAHEVLLRAERSLSADGRVYTITITATDQAGQSSTGQVTVTVPRHIIGWRRDD